MQLGFNLGQAWYFQRQGDAYAEASLALYRELFRRTSASSTCAPSSMIICLRQRWVRAFCACSITPRHWKTAFRVTIIGQYDYNQDRGDLALQVQAMDFATLETLRRRLGDAGQSGSWARPAAKVMASVRAW